MTIEVATLALAPLAAVLMTVLVVKTRGRIGRKTSNAKVVDQQRQPTIDRIECAAFNGAHCEAGLRLTQPDADSHLLARADVYIGYMTLSCEPGVVYFARAGASIFSPATGKPSAGCAVSVLSGEQSHCKSSSLAVPVAIISGEEEPILVSRRTEYVTPGSADFLPQFTVFSGTATRACDCVEGGVGSCWLVAAMASLAVHPEAILKLFTPGPTPGTHVVSLYDPNAKRTLAVTVDEALPACPTGSRSGAYSAAYTKASADTPSAIWPALLEKACAASLIYVSGGAGYEGLNGGDPGSALQVLTGGKVPIEIRTDAMAPSDLDALLVGYLQAGTHALCLASRIYEARAECDVLSKGGVQQNHAYSLLGCRPVERSARAAGALHDFQIRNPWGRLGLAQPGVPLRDPATDGMFWKAAAEIAELFEVVYVADLGGAQ